MCIRPYPGGILIGRLFEEAGLPAGVLHVLPGAAETGSALTLDPNVAMISFTGSTAVGREVGAAAGRTLKRVSPELGGNNALIVLDDADIDIAASAGAWSAFLHQGQICMTAGRHIVLEAVADQYLERLAERAGKLPVGDPNTEQVALGPSRTTARPSPSRTTPSTGWWPRSRPARATAGGPWRTTWIPAASTSTIRRSTTTRTRPSAGPVPRERCALWLVEQLG
jgi:hypothetical protein